jgi:serine/threonine-protein kinase
VPSPAEPTLVIGRYSLHSPIAAGGMGIVHFATVTHAGPDGTVTDVVAAKRLHPHLRHDQSFAMMLLDEARLAVSVRHPNVVQVMDVVSTPTDLLLVMEYVPGLSVHELMTHGLGDGRRAPVPLSVAITIVVDGLRGLHAAHEAVGEDGLPLNLVHRDISPQNLLVDASGVTKLTDFGVAKAVGRLRSTRDGSIRGKIAYMSPEQVADSGVDQRADIYSFAVVLWELIAGRPMFEAETDVALFGKAMRGPTQRVSEFAPDISPALDTAIWRALARDPRRRYPSARAFADALVDAYGAVDHGWVAEWMRERAGALLEQRQATVRDLLARDRDADDVDTITTVSQPVDVTSAPMMIDGPPARKRNYVQMGLLGFVAAGATVAILMFATSNRAEPPPPPLTQPEPVAMPAPPPPSASVVAAAVVSSKVVPAVAPAPAAAPKPRATAPKRPAEKDPKADCNPPYTEDETGKHFKSWCLRP